MNSLIIEAETKKNEVLKEYDEKFVLAKLNSLKN
jgi:hypothetical protein